MSDATQVSYYRDLIKNHGNSREAVGWGSEQSQNMRFEVMCQHLSFSGRSVLDVGCGRGDLLSYLNSTSRQPGRYTGMDLTEDMIQLAKANHPGISFLQGDFVQADQDVPKADFVVCSGVFNLLMEDHDSWIKAFVKRMFDTAKSAAAFNVISQHAPEHKPDYYYADPAEWLTYCSTLTPFVSLRHDYAVHDVTYILFHEENEMRCETSSDPD